MSKYHDEDVVSINYLGKGIIRINFKVDNHMNDFVESYVDVLLDEIKDNLEEAGYVRDLQTSTS